MSSHVSRLRLAMRFVMAFVFMFVGLFLPAGTLVWPEAWLFMAILSGWAFVAFGWLAKHRQALLAERLKSMKGASLDWDKVYTIGSTVLYIPMLIMPGLDAVRFGWSPSVLYLEALGVALLVVSLVGVFWTMRENPFLSRVVEIQAGQRVIMSGPYAIVRHPLYAFGLILFIAMPLALGSYWTFAPAVIEATLLVARTRGEDRMLHGELPGYAEYAQKVRWRLLPGVW